MQEENAEEKDGSESSSQLEFKDDTLFFFISQAVKYFSFFFSFRPSVGRDRKGCGHFGLAGRKPKKIVFRLNLSLFPSILASNSQQCDAPFSRDLYRWFCFRIQSKKFLSWTNSFVSRQMTWLNLFTTKWLVFHQLIPNCCFICCLALEIQVVKLASYCAAGIIVRDPYMVAYCTGDSLTKLWKIKERKMCWPGNSKYGNGTAK